MANHYKPSFDAHTYHAPPAYDDVVPVKRWSLIRPKTWGRKTYISLVVIAVVIIVAAVVGGVEGAKAAAYPNYYALSYTLADTYSGTSFFDNFDYFTGYDPSSGFVHYVPADTSTSYNLTYASSSSAVVRVDTSSGKYDTTTGRYSVRLTSKKQYNDGLFIFDVMNAPYGCSTWPAVWLSDPSNWPANGEIDVIESVNQATWGNQMTLHTTSGCSMNVKRKQTGSTVTTDCYNGTDSNAGCGVSGATDTVGQAFNKIGGGIYAMEWRNEGIRVWFFQRGSIPSDIPSSVSNSTAPDPSTWGEALADFPSTNCDISSHFRNASIIVNIDLCGSWAGATSVYSTEDQCPSTCTDFVAQNASAYSTAFWQFNSFRVYTAS
ncbi:hypothetical protein AMS68_001336 [Peltaster fructicola]|uniref:endo-1,3(4)-beta-glucanase n=1 Tax=Peltaster fructicola TaxID=286661 RepID=A0A6H0XMG5_9PEZI|nr:hypothetical protein AMS68_001336 [Peltaster fructicola]